jgi:hypothetical protein
MLTGSSSFERCHVVDDNEFSEVYESIFSKPYLGNSTEVQNIVKLAENFHRDFMDSLNKPKILRHRRLGFDFLNKVCYAEDFDTGEIEKWPWKVEGVDVHYAYFAWSNSENKSTKKIRRLLKKIDKRLVDVTHWAGDV